MADSRAKKRKVDDVDGLKVKGPFSSVLVYIVPKKLSKARLELLKSRSRDKGFTVAEGFSKEVTHVVTEYENIEKVESFLKRKMSPSITVVKVEWLTNCLSEGKLVPVTKNLKIQSQTGSPDISKYFVRSNPIAVRSLDSLSETSDGSTSSAHSTQPTSASAHSPDRTQSDVSLDTGAACLESEDVAVVTERNPFSAVSSEDYQFMFLQDTKYECHRATPLHHKNKRFTEALEVLEKNALFVDSAQRDSRALAFRRASCALKSYPREITNIKEAAKLNNIGKHSKKVIQEILENGSCEEVENIRESDFYKLMELFSVVYGCGSATGKKWIEKGFRSVDDVKKAVSEGMKITDQQKMGLKYYEQLAPPVPREQALRIKEIVAREVNCVEPGCTVELVGGYRRGKPSGHDVDILLTHQDDKVVEGLLPKLVEKLEKLGHIVHKDMHVGRNKPEELTKKTGGVMDRLDTCYCMFSSLASDAASSSSTSAVCRVDLIVAPASQFPFALLGWTGSKQFNRSLRLYAWKELKKAVSNHGIWDHNFTPPQKIEAKSEKEIFQALNVPYREPEDRNC